MADRASRDQGGSRNACPVRPGGDDEVDDERQVHGREDDQSRELVGGIRARPEGGAEGDAAAALGVSATGMVTTRSAGKIAPTCATPQCRRPTRLD